MLSRRAKNLFYKVAGPLMKVNGLVYRNFRAPRNGVVKVQLGPGQKNYLNGWINIDANKFTGKCDVWADLRNSLPFHKDSVDVFYSHHVIEHLPNIYFHLSEIYRCLKPGGVYRVGGPNGDSAISKFVEKDLNWFGVFPEKRKSIGGRMENFIFCKGEHLTILTFSMLEEFMSDIGFVKVKQCLVAKETDHPQFFSVCLPKEYESNFEVPHTLTIEARKPMR